jgi:hypothetical protein
MRPEGFQSSKITSIVWFWFWLFLEAGNTANNVEDICCNYQA